MALVSIDIIYYYCEYFKFSKIYQIEQRLSLKKYNKVELEALKKENIKYVLLGNLILDVSNYSKFHPGGVNNMDDFLYKDVTKYMYNHGNDDFPAHNHSYFGCKYALEKMTIGELVQENGLVYKVNESFNLQHLAIISNYTQIGNKLALIESTFPNEKQIKFTKATSKLDHVGKYFSVTSSSLNSAEFYYVCLSANRIFQEKHMIMLDNVFKAHSNKSNQIINPAIEDKELFSNNFEFLIKTDNKDLKVSSFIKKIWNKELNPNDDELTIRGPFGSGISPLFEDSNKMDKVGVYAFFATGHNIIKILDILAYFMRKTCYSLFPNNENQIFSNEIFNSKVRILVFTSFKDENNSFWFDLLTKMSEICEIYKSNEFKSINRFSNKEERWTKEFILEELNKVGEVSKFFLAGTSDFNKNITEYLCDGEEAKFKKDQIVTI